MHAASLWLGTGPLTAFVNGWNLLFTVFLPNALINVVLVNLWEEGGWTGFLLSRLQERWGALRASLILGSLHGLWHLPALMTMNFGPLPLASYVPFMLTAALATVIYTWVYNHSDGSILLAILLHAASNATSGWLTTLFSEAGMEPPSVGLAGFLASTSWINVIAYGIVALLLIIATRGQLGYQPDNAIK